MGSEISSTQAGTGVTVAVGLLVLVGMIWVVDDSDSSATCAGGEPLNTPETNRTASVSMASPPITIGMNLAQFEGPAPPAWISSSFLCVFFCRGDITEAYPLPLSRWLALARGRG